MKIIILLLTLLTLLNTSIIPLNSAIISQIYQQHKSYFIYVHSNNHELKTQAIFNSYCFGEKDCAILQPNVQNYQHIRQHIGKNDQQYFLIIDPINRLKYIYQVPDSVLTSETLLQFQYNVTHRLIQPFFASEPLPEHQDQYCSKLVGSNLGEFIRRKDRLKVIFLYSLTQHCTNCPQALQDFILFAQQNRQQKTVAFGYFNVFLNDHPVIRDEKTPFYLIFVDQQYQNPFDMPADTQALKNFISSTLRPRKTDRTNQL